MKTTTQVGFRAQPLATAPSSAARGTPSQTKAAAVDSIVRVGKPKQAHAGDVIAWHDFATKLIDKVGLDGLMGSQRLAVAVGAQMKALASTTGDNARVANAAIAGVLGIYFPDEATSIGKFASKLGLPKTAGDTAMAVAIAADAIAARAGDGTEDNRPVALPEGKWQPKDPSQAPLRPRWGQVRMWVAANDAITVPPPPAEGSDIFAHSYRLTRNSYDVRRILETDASSKRKALGASFASAAAEWANENPWNDVLVAEIKAHALSPQATAKLLFAYHVMRADAYVAVWKAKYDPASGFVRRPWQIEPNDPIKEAVELPNAPSYPSGHAGQGGAISALLTQVFPEKKVEWLSMAAEARASRIVGGLSYLFDSASAAMGRKVAVNVMKELGIGR